MQTSLANSEKFIIWSALTFYEGACFVHVSVTLYIINKIFPRTWGDTKSVLDFELNSDNKYKKKKSAIYTNREFEVISKNYVNMLELFA